MSPIIRVTSVGLALAVALSGCVSTYDYTALRAKRDLLEGDNAQLQDQVDQLQARVTKLSADLEARRREANTLRETYQGLLAEMEAELASGKVTIDALSGGVRVRLSNEILFDPGSTELGASGVTLLARVASQLEGSSHRIDVHGHTDNVAIGGALAERYPTNWELAGARASRVVRLFAAAGIAEPRLSAVSRGDSEPVASNSDAAGRARNRRIDIRLVPALDFAAGGATEPAD